MQKNWIFWPLTKSINHFTYVIETGKIEISFFGEHFLQCSGHFRADWRADWTCQEHLFYLIVDSISVQLGILWIQALILVILNFEFWLSWGLVYKTYTSHIKIELFVTLHDTIDCSRLPTKNSVTLIVAD